MTVQTYRITWGAYRGFTKVILRNDTGRDISMLFRDRNDAVALLKTLRKRVR